jgi:alginate O-acetyltransferase complex protein AlgI
MVFSSNIFLFAVLPVFLGIYYSIRLFNSNLKIANISLLVMSIAFYFMSTGAQGSILVVAIIANWLLARHMGHSRGKKVWLSFGVVVNLSIICWFKYACFFINMVSSKHSCENGEIPVGISFFVFMAIAYLVDVYRRSVLPSSLISFGTYLSLFPHLVAGPIVRYSELDHEINKGRRHSIEMFHSGLVLFSIGFAQKVLIADNISVVADAVFGLPADMLSTEAAWIGALSYTIQILFDFSGYTNMALGIAKMFGFHFPPNFNQPYRSVSITEFWRRWHMTLSRWFRDYLYIPLGGNRGGAVRTYFNLFVVFLLCGLWHGAAYTFVIWGAYHGVLLAAERLAHNRFSFRPSGLGGGIYTMLAVMVGWVLFRSTSFDSAANFIRTMFVPKVVENSYGMSNVDNSTLFVFLVGVAISIAPLDKVKLLFQGVNERMRVVSSGVVSLVFLLLSLAVLSSTSFKPFIYFRF